LTFGREAGHFGEYFDRANEPLSFGRLARRVRDGFTEVVKARTTPPRQLCNVALLTAGPNRMGLIKLLATKSPFGVQAARAAVDAPPAECPEPMPNDAARALAAAVQELGGTLELKNVREVPGHIVSDPSPGG
jgi:ribosomal L7/L12-like protein